MIEAQPSHDLKVVPAAKFPLLLLLLLQLQDQSKWGWSFVRSLAHSLACLVVVVVVVVGGSVVVVVVAVMQAASKDKLDIFFAKFFQLRK